MTEGPECADVEVLVVGAGITGLSAAHHLVRGGARVAVVDGRLPAGGATGRSAGLALAGTGQHLSRLRLAIGDEAAAAILRLSVENREILAGMPGVQRTGSLRLALSPREIPELERSARLLEEAGVVHRIVGRVEARHLSGAAPVVAGMVVPGDLVMDPAAFVRGMVTALEGAGTSVTWGERVVAFEEGADGRVIARTATGAGLRAEMVVVACEAWTTSLLPELADRLLPARAQALAVALAGEDIGRLPAVTNFGHELWRVAGNGRLILTGGREASEKSEWLLSEETGDRVQAALTKFLGALFPALANAPVLGRWAGAGAFACDEVPLIGPVAGSRPVLLAAGWGGWGTSLGAAAGKRLADLVLEGRCVDQAIFSPRRFLE